jgi:hypothetical protein
VAAPEIEPGTSVGNSVLQCLVIAILRILQCGKEEFFQLPVKLE